MLRRDGVRALAREVLRRLRPQTPKLDEAKVVFDVLRGTTNGVLVDVGAHHGGSLAPFADAGWRVLAFEPDATNRATLVTRFGRCNNVTIDPRGVSDKPAHDVAFFRSELSTGISGLSAFHESHAQSGTIDVTTLADASTQYDIARIDLLKIDTEGFDLFVLRGVPWDRLHPRAILCEFEDSKTTPLGYTFHELARFLVDRGYRVMVSEWKPIERYGATHTWRRFVSYPCELSDVKAWGNLIAVEAALHDNLVAACSRVAANLDKK
ncbi:MAG: FkbM family methyltransferase [Kofleriaceae bacterium]